MSDDIIMEPRHAIRISSCAAVRAALVGADGQIGPEESARLHNVSTTGFAIRANWHLPPGSLLQVTMPVADRSLVFITTIIRVDQVEEGLNQLALQIRDDHLETLVAIEGLALLDVCDPEP